MFLIGYLGGISLKLKGNLTNSNDSKSLTKCNAQNEESGPF